MGKTQIVGHSIGYLASTPQDVKVMKNKDWPEDIGEIWELNAMQYPVLDLKKEKDIRRKADEIQINSRS